MRITQAFRPIWQVNQESVSILDQWESVANDSQVKYVVNRAWAAEMHVVHLNAPLPEIDASSRVYQDADVSIYAF